jgi:hypothetical protein
MMREINNNEKPTVLREATISEALLTIHTLWNNLLMSKSVAQVVLKNIYHVELVTLAKDEITVKSPDGKMTHSIKI